MTKTLVSALLKEEVLLPKTMVTGIKIHLFVNVNVNLMSNTGSAGTII